MGYVTMKRLSKAKAANAKPIIVPTPSPPKKKAKTVAAPARPPSSPSPPAPAPTDTRPAAVPAVPAVPSSSDIEDLQYANLTGDEDEHKMCRICFSSEERNPLLGQLFQPCRCSGTMRWIHVKCLN